MKHLNTKNLVCTAVASFVLSACAGGGGVAVPDGLVIIPTLKAVDTAAENVKKHNDSPDMLTLTTNGGKVDKLVVSEMSSWGWMSENEIFAYETPDGKTYRFGNFNTVIAPAYSSPSKQFLTNHPMQSTDNGGKIFACCTGSHRDHPALNSNDMKFGAWVSPTGDTSLFVGGIAADANYMQGGSAAELNGKKGKASYDVWGLRVKNGNVVSSSYTPASLYGSTDKQSVVSRVTVNFNTGKLGGEIIGNDDFGDSVVMKDVSVNGNRFSGTASSGSAAGQVNGAFFGKHATNWSGGFSEAGGASLGGTVKFSDSSLDTVFGGTRQQMNMNDESKDLTPLPVN